MLVRAYHERYSAPPPEGAYMSLSTVLALASLIGAPTPPAPIPATKPEELVRLLGDKSYRVREVAARELIRRGSASVDALTAATKHTDPEVSERARQLLPQAAAVERNEKLVQLVKNPSAPPPKGLAGLTRFLKATGDTKEARELYVEMMNAHSRTIEAADTDPKSAALQFSEFGNEAYQKYYQGARTGRYTFDNLFNGRGDITFFLFISGDTRVRGHDTGNNYTSILFNGTQLNKAIVGKDASPAIQKIFLDWLEHEPQPWLQQNGFNLAAQAGMKEALPLLLRVLQDKNREAFARGQVMVSLVKLGTKEHVHVLDTYLKDETSLGSINFGNGPQLSVQVRDVAMGVQVQLAGQKLVDYGFDKRFGGNGGLSYHYYGFPEDENGKSKARDEAHAKWAEWTKKNLGTTPVEKTVPKTPEKKQPTTGPAKATEKGPTTPAADPAPKAADKGPKPPEKK
jgi:hypothetical protein